MSTRTGRSEVGEPLRRRDLPLDPMIQVERWHEDSVSRGGPLHMTLCTLGADGMPDARIVPFRGIDRGGVLLHTDLGSRKGRAILDRPDAIAAVLYDPVELRQVRMLGRADVLDEDVAEAAFRSRPRAAQLRAWSQRSDGEVDGRATLLARAEDMRARHLDATVPRPPGWAVVRVVAREVELFQAAADGCHDRFRYRRSDEGWTLSRQAP